MINISTNTVIQRIPDVLSSEMDDELVMMSIQNGEYYGLDPTGKRIWQLIEKPITYGQLIETLIAEYDVDRTECENDVKEFLDVLFKKNLLQIS